MTQSVQIMCINKTDENHLALNLSDSVSDSMVQELNARYGKIRFSASGNVLMLDLSARGAERAPSPVDLANWQQSIDEISTSLCQAQRKRQKMLLQWSDDVALPLDGTWQQPFQPD